MSSNDAVLDAMIEVLGASALPRDKLTRRLETTGKLGASTGVEQRLASILQRDPRFSEVADGVIFVPAILEGSTWTVHVDRGDAAEGFLRVRPQLSPLGWWLVVGVDLADADGTALGELRSEAVWLDDRDTGVVYGPPGWLDAVAGRWAAVSVRGGALCVTSITDPPDPRPRQAAALRLGFERMISALDPMLSDDQETTLEFTVGDGSLFEAMLIDREAFITFPVPLLSDLYRAAGLVERNEIIAVEGFDWDALASRQHRNRVKHVYGLDDSQVEALTLLFGGCVRYAGKGPQALGREERERDGRATVLSELLEDGAVGVAFWDEAQYRGVSVDAIAAFADELAGRTSDGALAGVAWLRSRCLDERGDARGALEVLELAVDEQCAHRPALLALAGFASDRGDAASAWRLLRHARTTDLDALDNVDAAELIDEVGPFALHRPRAMAGRNDPCPCGSGRKYKACHLGREQHTLAERSLWLYSKARRFMRRFALDTMLGVADGITVNIPSYDDDMAESTLVGDLVLHEYGVFEDFLHERGWLLPEDEALLAAQWGMVDRGVFEITRIHDDALVLHDIGRGEDIRVVNTTPSDETRVGMVLVGRPLPVGDAYRAFGGFLPWPRQLVNPMLDAIADGDPDSLVDLIASTLGPPLVRNTAGHDLVLHTMTWSVPADTDVADALSSSSLVAEGPHSWRLVEDSEAPSSTVVATLAFEPEAAHLRGEVNSDERAELLVHLVAHAIPGVELIDDHRRPMEEMLDDHEPSDGESPAALDDPEVRQLVDELMIIRERGWIDEPIPALGGRTPRDAVTDPIGLEQVEQLLDSVPAPRGHGMAGMQASRIRALLGLEQQ